MKGERINYCLSERHNFLQEQNKEPINVYRTENNEDNEYKENNIKKPKEKINYYGR